MPDALSKLLHPLDTEDSVPIDDAILKFEFSPAASEQRLKEKKMLGISFLEPFF